MGDRIKPESVIRLRQNMQGALRKKKGAGGIII